jgi:hypothetical protein
MTMKIKNSLTQVITGALALLFTSTSALAWHGGGGEYHGGGGYYHAGGSGYYHGNGYYHGGGYYGNTWGGSAVVIGTPYGGYYNPNYYAQPLCQTTQICNQSGNCWSQNTCN